jgi:hypothetical protein
VKRGQSDSEQEPRVGEVNERAISKSLRPMSCVGALHTAVTLLSTSTE